MIKLFSASALPLILLLTSAIITTGHTAPRQALVPGGIALIDIPDYDQNTRVYFKDKRVAVYPHNDSWRAITGISLSTKPGSYPLTIKHSDGSSKEIPINIKDKQYQEQRLTITNKRKVNPAPMDMERIGAERIRKRDARTYLTYTTPRVDFIWPVTGRISSVFGLRRFFNDQERKPHSGLDIAAAEGTPIKATADGTVIDTGDFFFSGNMIYIDHGQGIISLYAHLSRIDVKNGDKVRQGDIIGAVGQTGRVTGAHLHFAVYANQTLIDPAFMLPEDQPEPMTKPVPVQPANSTIPK